MEMKVVWNWLEAIGIIFVAVACYTVGSHDGFHDGLVNGSLSERAAMCSALGFRNTSTDYFPDAGCQTPSGAWYFGGAIRGEIVQDAKFQEWKESLNATD